MYTKEVIGWKNMRLQMTTCPWKRSLSVSEWKTLWKLNFSETMTHDNDCVFNACVYIKHKCKLMRFQPLKVPFSNISVAEWRGPQRLNKNKFLQLVPTCWRPICDQWKLNTLNTSSWNHFSPSATIVTWNFSVLSNIWGDVFRINKNFI